MSQPQTGTNWRNDEEQKLSRLQWIYGKARDESSRTLPKSKHSWATRSPRSVLGGRAPR